MSQVITQAMFGIDDDPHASEAVAQVQRKPERRSQKQPADALTPVTLIHGK